MNAEIIRENMIRERMVLSSMLSMYVSELWDTHILWEMSDSIATLENCVSAALLYDFPMIFNEEYGCQVIDTETVREWAYQWAKDYVDELVENELQEVDE